jgi:DNA-binding winged helix-turn-helix (wHTH) protein/tetratricopeptide (TPR) repeat protein
MSRFPPFRLDTLNHCLWKEDAQGKSEPVGLAPKTFDVLRHLVESGGRLVRHEELLDALWKDGNVQPEVLKGHILTIRAALGDDAQNPRFIETHRGRGYRFIAGVDHLAVANGAGTTRRRTASFVGREREIDALRTALDCARSGKLAMVFVNGEPGMGKTTLINHFLDQVTDGSAARVVVGHAVESHGTSEPYFPIFEALTHLIKNDGKESAINTLLSTAPSWALQLPGLLSVERWASLQHLVGGPPRNRMLGEFCDFVEALTVALPMVVVLEDLHWADFSTIDLLTAIARRRSASKLLVIGTYRKENAMYNGHPIGELVQTLLPYDMCTELSLPPLSGSEVGNLIATEMTAEQVGFANFVTRQAGGNPLFVSIILDHLIQRKFVEKLDAGWKLLIPANDMVFDAPITLANIVELQVQQLTADQQATLECASIFGASFDARNVASIGKADEWAVEQHLESLSRSSMFISRGDIEYAEHRLPFRRYLFRHAAYQAIFYERQLPTLRARRHLLAARALSRSSAKDDSLDLVSELARHFEAAGDWALALKQLHLLLIVAKKRFARRDAIAIIERAEANITRLPHKKRDMEEISWLEEKASIQAANHDSDALETYELLVEKAAEIGVVDTHVRALLGLAFVYSWHDEANCLVTLDRALQVSSTQQDLLQGRQSRISCYVWKIWVGGWDRDAASACDRLVAELQESNDETPAAWSMIEYSMLYLLSTRYRECQETITASLHVLLNKPSDRPDYDGVRAIWMVSLGVPWCDLLLGNLGTALERFDANIAMLEKNASFYSANMLRLMRAQLYFHALDFQAVLDECKIVMRSVDERIRGEVTHNLVSLPGEKRTCQLMLGLAQAGLGNLKNATRQLLQVERDIIGRPVNFDWYRLLFLEWTLAGAYVLQGDLENARLRADKFLARAQATDEMCWHALAWETLARVAIVADDIELASDAIARALRTVESHHVPLASWHVYRTAATVHAKRGDREQVERAARQFMRERQNLIESLPQGHRVRQTLAGLQLDMPSD